MTTLDLLLSFTTVSCGKEGCAHVFAVPTNIYDLWRKTHETWYCPSGHPRFYSSESEAEKLRKQVVAKQAALDQAHANAEFWRKKNDATCRRAAAARGQVTRIKNRVGKGVCPCCSRSFSNLREHMATKHPEHASEAEVAAAKKRRGGAK